MKLKHLSLYTAIICLILVSLTTPAFSAVYYVKNGGNDNSDGLSDGNAWATLGKVNTFNFANNDVVQLKRGSGFTDATLNLNGTSAGRSGIKIQDYGSGNKPRIDGNSVQPIVINHALVNLTIRNLDISGSDTSGNRCAIEYVNGLTIDGLDYNGHTGSSTYYRSNVINIAQVDGAIEIKNCTIQNVMKATFAESNTAWGWLDTVAIMLWYSVNHKTSGSVSIHNNTTDFVYGDGLHLAGVQVETLVYNNTFTRFGEEAIDIKGCRYTKVYQNEMAYYNIGRRLDSYWGGGSAMVIHGDPNYIPYSTSDNIEVYENYIHDSEASGLPTGYELSSDVKVYRNYIKDVCMGIEVSNSHGAKVYNNVIESTDAATCRDVFGNGAGIWFKGGTTVKDVEIYNNTIYIESGATDHEYGISFYANQTGSIVKNNIFYVDRNSGYNVYWNGAGSEPTMSHNAYYNANHINRVSWDSTVYDSTEQAAWISAGHTGALFTDPALNAPGSGDFTLTTRLTAIDLGDTYKDGLSATTTWDPISVVTIDRDVVGWDMGAMGWDLSVYNVSPTDGGEGISITASATWSHSDYVDDVELWLDTGACDGTPDDGDLDCINTDDCVGDESSADADFTYDMSTLVEATTYCLTLQTNYGAEQGDWQQFEFTTTTGPPAPPAGLAVGVYSSSGLTGVYDDQGATVGE